MVSWDWIYGNTPNFTNNLEKRFDWGILDIYFEVKEGMIVSGKVYSDCLYVEFITKLNDLINSGKYSYHVKGMSELCKDLRAGYTE